MAPENGLQLLSRRALLRNAALGMASLTLLPGVRGEAQTPGKTLYTMFRLGIQSYSLRGFKTEEMLAKTQSLGLKWLEAYPDHFPLTDDPKVIAGYLDQLKAHDIRMPVYGVVDFSNDEADARRKFAFAKAMNIRTFSASPNPDAFALLDKLTEEYKVNIAIHNHGPGDRYDTWEKVLQAVDGHSPRIGACLDTGHLLRSGEIPDTAAAKYGKRLLDVHLKNVKNGENGEKQFTEIGVVGGLLDTINFFKAMQSISYRGPVMLEYEEHEDNPMPYVEQCFATMKKLLDV